MPIWRLQQLRKAKCGRATDGIEIHGLDTMQQKLTYISTRYPYESELLLRRMGNKFRNSVKKRMPDSGMKAKGNY